MGPTPIEKGIWNEIWEYLQYIGVPALEAWSLGVAKLSRYKDWETLKTKFRLQALYAGNTLYALST